MKDYLQDTRRSTRKRKSSALFWKTAGSSRDFDMAWLLEASEVGCAFAWRGDDPPKRGERLQLRVDCLGTIDQPSEAIVRRATTVHDDLTVVSVEFHKHLPTALASVRTDIRIEATSPEKVRLAA
ncbi:hypothetical protein [Mucisphaera calidilacus]|uniref:PilZ domain-containing protein n=1 Tax=Mucisphaera calidilacus TaxID=2527982 RepID=A0A518BU44_9BACT|nr:hypothetical protein [Mucisphaera calidilacus]QDU70512.1 hypothetical protein Pan265_03400 [Mucisphaera calidilacus]